eukprot:3583907-Lingulodinium_polyedra.AAC.1
MFPSLEALGLHPGEFIVERDMRQAKTRERVRMGMVPNSSPGHVPAVARPFPGHSWRAPGV